MIAERGKDVITMNQEETNICRESKTLARTLLLFNFEAAIEIMEEILVEIQKKKKRKLYPIVCKLPY